LGDHLFLQQFIIFSPIYPFSPHGKWQNKPDLSGNDQFPGELLRTDAMLYKNVREFEKRFSL
jgi:hypothetical protein